MFIFASQLCRRNHDDLVMDYKKTEISVQMLSQEEDWLMYVESYSQLGFRLNTGVRIIGPCAVFPKSILHWNVSKIVNHSTHYIKKVLHHKYCLINEMWNTVRCSIFLSKSKQWKIMKCLFIYLFDSCLMLYSWIFHLYWIMLVWKQAAHGGYQGPVAVCWNTFPSKILNGLKCFTEFE